MKSFTESQRFNQWWLWAILLASPVIVIVANMLQHPGIGFPNAVNNIGVAIGLPLILMLRLFVLGTTVDEDGVSYQFFPIHHKPRKKSWDEISSAYVRQYRPIAEYGGWGI